MLCHSQPPPSPPTLPCQLQKIRKNKLQKSVFQFMLKKSVSLFLIPTTGKIHRLCYRVMKDASKQKVTGPPHTQQMTLHVIANPTKLCTPGSIISEMLLFNASTVWKKIHSIWMKDEYITPNMGKNINLKSIPLYARTRW